MNPQNCWLTIPQKYELTIPQKCGLIIPQTIPQTIPQKCRPRFKPVALLLK